MNAPALLPFPNAASQVQEVTQSSTPEVVWEMDLVAAFNRLPSVSGSQSLQWRRLAVLKDAIRQGFTLQRKTVGRPSRDQRSPAEPSGFVNGQHG